LHAFSIERLFKLYDCDVGGPLDVKGASSAKYIWDLRLWKQVGFGVLLGMSILLIEVLSGLLIDEGFVFMFKFILFLN